MSQILQVFVMQESQGYIHCIKYDHPVIKWSLWNIPSKHTKKKVKFIHKPNTKKYTYDL